MASAAQSLPTSTASQPVTSHAHGREDEAFWGAEGRVTIYLEGDRKLEAEPGSYGHIPAGTGHGFRTHMPLPM